MDQRAFGLGVGPGALAWTHVDTPAGVFLVPLIVVRELLTFKEFRYFNGVKPEASVESLKKSILYIPSTPNYPVFDAALVYLSGNSDPPKINLHLIQFTVDTNLEMKVDKIKRALESTSTDDIEIQQIRGFCSNWVKFLVESDISNSDNFEVHFHILHKGKVNKSKVTNYGINITSFGESADDFYRFFNGSLYAAKGWASKKPKTPNKN